MSIIIPANSAAGGGFEVSNGIMLNNSRLFKTPSSSGSQRKFTFSAWVKKSDFSSGVIFSSGEADGNPNFALYFASNDKLNLYSSQGMEYKTEALFLDPGAWMHIVISVDTAISNASNRQLIWVNGVQQTSFSTSNSIAQNTDLSINTSAYRMAVGTGVDNQDYFGGYVAEVVFLDNQALGHLSFGEFDSDSGIWKPIAITGSAATPGTNGFYLNFQDSSNLGNDEFGGTDLSVSDIVARDQVTDTCTNNFATLNPIDFARWQNNTPEAVLANGALQTGIGSSEKVLLRSTIGVKKGKWYWEAKSDGVSKMFFGVCNSKCGTDANAPHSSSDYVGVYYYEATPYYAYYSGAGNPTNGIASISSGDILNFALDCDNQTFYIGKNGTYMNSGNPASGATGTGSINRLWNYASSLFYIDGIQTEMFASCYVSSTSGSGTAQYNFGNPTFTGTDKSDDNDRGSFEYQPPAGYLALCTANLSETNS